MSLLGDLAAAERAARGETSCGLCQIVERHSGDERAALESAAGGTIGERKLTELLAKHGLRDNNGNAVARRTIERHRKEGHQ
jgi:hypothetical protein